VVRPGPKIGTDRSSVNSVYDWRLYVTAPRTIRNTHLGHKARSNTGGLRQLIVTAAGQIGVPVEPVP